MPQTVQILRTDTNNSPAPLLEGELSAVLSAQTKMFIGAAGGNRMLLSTDPADMGEMVGGRLFVPVAGGTMTGALTVTNNTITVNGTSNRGMILSNSNVAGLNVSGFGSWNTASNNGFGIWWSSSSATVQIGQMSTAAGSPSGGTGWINASATRVSFPLPIDMTGTGANTLISSVGVPVNNVHLTNKLYVDTADAAIEAQLADYLPLIGGTLTGPLNLPAAQPTADAMATNKAYVDLRDTELQDQIDLLADNLIFSGQIDIPTDDVTWTNAAQGSAGVVNGPLPLPAANLRGFYVIVSTPGSPPVGNVPPGTYNRGDWIVCDGTQWVEVMLGLTNVIAPSVALSPAITNLGPNVQTGLQWLTDNKVNKAGDAMTGGLTFGSAIAPGGPTDLSRHISLFGANFGIGVTTGQINYVAGGVHSFMTGATVIATLGAATSFTQPVTMQNTLTVLTPALDMQAATKLYVDTAVGGIISAVATDGSLTGDGTAGDPLSVLLVDGGEY